MSFKENFIAWWHGTPLPRGRSDGPTDEAAADSDAASRPQAAAPSDQWEAGRIELLEKLWGDGLVFPGGEEHLMKLIAPFGLNPAFSVADFGAGLGGAGQRVADEYGAWVNGYEFDPEIASHAEERTERLGLQRKAPVTYVDPESLSIRENAFHCAYSIGTFFTLQNKSHVLRMIEKGLHPGGQFAFTDYVVAEEGRDDPALALWREAEMPTPHPWSPKRYDAELTNMNLDVRIAEDASEAHQRAILAGWATLVEGLRPGGVSRRTTLLMIEETEKWVRRVAALRAGGLRYYRFYVTKPTQ